MTVEEEALKILTHTTPQSRNLLLAMRRGGREGQPNSQEGVLKTKWKEENPPPESLSPPHFRIGAPFSGPTLLEHWRRCPSWHTLVRTYSYQLVLQHHAIASPLPLYSFWLSLTNQSALRMSLACDGSVVGGATYPLNDHPDLHRSISIAEFNEWTNGEGTPALLMWPTESSSSFFTDIAYLLFKRGASAATLRSFFDYFIPNCLEVDATMTSPYRVDKLQLLEKRIQELETEIKAIKSGAVVVVPPAHKPFDIPERHEDFPLTDLKRGDIISSRWVFVVHCKRILNRTYAPITEGKQITPETCDGVDIIDIHMAGIPNPIRLHSVCNKDHLRPFTAHDVKTLWEALTMENYAWFPYVLQSAWRDCDVLTSLEDCVQHTLGTFLAIDDHEEMCRQLCNKLQMSRLFEHIDWEHTDVLDWVRSHVYDYELEIPDPYTDKVLTHIIFQYTEDIG